MPVLQTGLAKSGAEAYTIDQSLRFSDGYLRKSFSSGTDPDKLTISCWVKPANLGGSTVTLFFGYTDDDNYEKVCWNASGGLYWNRRVSGSVSFEAYTSMVFRDPASWYHLVLVYDSTDVTTSSRIKFYVNGVLQTKSVDSPTPPTNLDSLLLSAPCTVGAYDPASAHASSQYFKSYMAECHAIDGQALDASSFGETDAATNQWKPIEYTGSYGTNGFYLKFQDSAALGDDSSGNTNDFTPTNLVATDQMVDTPTNCYATINPLYNGNFTFSEGNLKIAGPQASTGVAYSTIAQDSGKWYFEMLYDGVVKWRGGIAPINEGADGASANLGTVIDPNNYIYNFFTGASAQDISGTTISTDDVIGVAFNMDDNEVDFYVNNVQVGVTASLGTPTTPWGAFFLNYSTSGDADPTYRLNFGADSSFFGTKTAQGNQDSNSIGDFYHEPPTDFLALCSSNLPSPEIALPTAHFNTKLYTGTGSELAITGVGFQPDFTWIKQRSIAWNHRVFDVVRGVTEELYTNDTDAEVTDAQSLKTFDSDGFTLGTSGGVNPDPASYTADMVSWNWKAGSSASGTTGGSGTSKSYTAKYSTDAGISIIGFEGNDTAGHTVPHHLSVAPELVIVKNRTNAAHDWQTGSDYLTSWEYRLKLNDSVAEAAVSSSFDSTAPSSSVITLGSNSDVNEDGSDMIIYAFHSVEGYSKVGSYEGNGDDDGPFVYTGFRPAMVIFKRYETGDTADWELYDNKRGTYNAQRGILYPNANTAESSSTFGDFLSNGFKVRGDRGATNRDGAGYLYITFAESPFKTSNAR